MAAPAAPAAGAGIEAIAALFLIVAFVVLLGMGQAWRATIGWLLNKLADLLDAVSFSVAHVTIAPFGHVADALRAISHNVWVALNTAALKCEKSAVWLFNQAAAQIRWIGKEIGDLADAVFRGIDHVVTREIPAAVAQATKPLARKLRGIDAHLGRLEALAHAQWARLRHGIDRVTRIATHTLPARIARVERTAKAQAGRLSRVERRLAAAGFTALTLTALRRLGLGWLRCGNVGKAGRAVCGMNPSVLESLLLDAALLTVAFNLEEFAEEMQSVVGEAAALIHKFAE